MVYIITEDSGAGKIFWEAIALYAGTKGKKVSVIAANGVTRIPEILYELFEGSARDSITAYDSFLLAIDCVIATNTEQTMDSGYAVLDIQDYFVEKCAIAGAKHYMLNCYCFEELLLSFRGISKLVGVDSGELYEVARLVQEYVWQGAMYWTDRDTLISAVPPDLMYRNRIVRGREVVLRRNREQFAAALLERYTRQAQGRKVTVSKGKIGDCWIKDCCATGVYGGKCTNCIHGGSALGLKKIEMLINKTILSQLEASLLTELFEVKEAL